MIPQGYKLYTGSSPAVTAKATSLLSQDYGYQELVNLDGKELLFIVETHAWYGSQPNKPPTPHKGITVYEKEDGNTDMSRPLAGMALIGLGLSYLLWHQK
jgi:hypothetical protein